ncbi:hypothetical protein N7478_007343 [Penicillium angulare]|uniref:uncharacterized protein n=1 Tax=Penicillium angulare TaxID=116970 RepID=UPI0025423464|nr:uncharacterized protein N7478_007343 [Penicillium angulare]KAJ5281971.1 hypothetical protein N7478_007343 [Penicillium angulare]
MLRSCFKAAHVSSPVSLSRTHTPSSIRLFTSSRQNVYQSNRFASTMAHIPPAVIKVQGPHNTSNPDHESHLQTQLQSISRNVAHLLIDTNTPSDAEWALLSTHFHAVEDLELESGFSEELNDRCLPRHWPLKKLKLSSACGELIQSPFVRQGLVQHLSLYFTCNLRFEGPTTEEFWRLSRETKVPEEKDAEGKEGNEKGIEITYLPEVVVNYMQKVHLNPDRKLDPENEPPEGAINLRTLEIWENDAMDTFCHFSAALPHLADNLHTLRLRSTSGLDFGMIAEGTFRQLLPVLENLKVLNYTVGDVFHDPLFLQTIHKLLPPNLTTLYFRAPASIATSDQWPNWLRVFESREFLPHLEDLAFVLDLHYEDRPDGSSGRKEGPAPMGLLHQARQECENLYAILRRRGINVVSMPSEPDSSLLRPVDLRW